MNPVLLEPGQSLASLLIAVPALAPWLAAHGVDIGCSGHRPAGETCARAGVDWETVARWAGEVTTPPSRRCACARAADMTLPELVSHIIECHHRRVETMLDQLRPETVRWANSASSGSASLRQLACDFVMFANQVREHFRREQTHAFGPLLKLAKADANSAAGSPRPAIGHPLAVLFLDHDHVFDALGNILGRVNPGALREASSQLSVQVLAGLTDLRAELHQVMHEENNLLFALGLGLERARATGQALPGSPRHLGGALLTTFTELRAYRVAGGRPQQ